jgi:hypothetical protein
MISTANLKLPVDEFHARGKSLERWNMLRKILTPEGLFIYDRHTGLCLFTPDVRSRRWIKPLYAQIALTNRCNLSCWFCYNRSSPESNLEWRLDDLKQLISFLDSWGLFGVSFGGGEPFLYPHLAEIARHAWEETGLDVSLTTNGLAASNSKIAKVERFVSEVRVSVRDKASLASLRRFIGRRFEVGVNLLLFRGVRLNWLIEEALKLGVNDFLINSFVAVGGSSAEEPAAPDFAELAETIRRYEGEASFKVSSRIAEALKKHISGLVPFVGEGRGRVIAVTADRKIKLSSLSEVGLPFTSCGEIPRLYNNLVGGSVYEA